MSAEIIVMRTNTGVAALVTGSVDFTTAGGSTMRAAVNGAPIKMVLNANKKAIFGFSRRKIFSAVEDLRGKIIGVGLGESIGRSLCTERDFSPRLMRCGFDQFQAAMIWSVLC